MRSNILNQLTVEDIKEIYETTDQILQQGAFWESWDALYRTVLRKLKEVKDYRPLCNDRYPTLVEAAEYVTNSTFVPTSRTASNAFIKCMIAHRLHEERYSYSEIGRTMGLSHATVIYYVNKMNDMMSLPKMFESEITEYEAFKSNL